MSSLIAKLKRDIYRLEFTLSFLKNVPKQT